LDAAARTFAGRHGLADFNTSVRDTMVSQTIASPDDRRFRASLLAADLGQLRLVAASVGPLTARRASGRTRSAAGSVFLLLSDRGEGTITHRDGTDRIAPDRFVVVPGSEAFDAAYTRASRVVFVALPGPVVADRFPALDGRIRSWRLGPTAAGAGRRLVDVTRAAAASDDAADAGDLHAILDATIHLLLRRTIGDCAGDPRSVLRVEALRLVDRHLSDPRLTPAWVATQLGVSLRHLHRAFEGSGRTVAGRIRDRRLDACARALTDPMHASRSVADIAWTYGFSSASQLAVWFRRRYDTTPGEWRAERVGAPERSDPAAEGSCG
jgi:AraC-like DNA-binding protein